MTAGGGRTYTVALTQPDGSILARVRLNDAGSQPSRVAMPWISSSLTRVYYLSAGSEVRYFGRDGISDMATKIAITPDELAGFSVSPDDKRIAVSIFTYSPEVNGSRTYVGMRMYVEDLNGGGNHVNIFSSASVAEFPIGWVGGRLIVAVATPWGLSSRPNPYDASEYHVISPGNGDRLATLCANSRGPVGWIQPFGTMCSQWNGGPSFMRWDGSAFSGPPEAPNAIEPWSIAMSPDGGHAAVRGNPMQVVGGGPTNQLPVSAMNVFGWLDGRHIVYQKTVDNGLVSGPQVLSFDLQTLTAVGIDLNVSTYRGAFPVAVS
jgi:hypothetical protein